MASSLLRSCRVKGGTNLQSPQGGEKVTACSFISIQTCTESVTAAGVKEPSCICYLRAQMAACTCARFVSALWRWHSDWRLESSGFTIPRRARPFTESSYCPHALQGRILANIEKRNIEGKSLMLLTTQIWKARQSTSNLVSDPIYREFLKRQPSRPSVK